MSRIGKQPVILPANVTANLTERSVEIVGPQGTMNFTIPPALGVERVGETLVISCRRSDKPSRSLFGTFRSKLHNAVAGVATPWVKSMEIRGTGYKFTLSGNKLVVICGFIHPVNVTFPTGVTGQLTDDTKLVLQGYDREVVGQVASNIRKIKPPEPYKGKGIRYAAEFVKLKAGKTAKS
jgi:large subunit ribosomal protein L6